MYDMGSPPTDVQAVENIWIEFQLLYLLGCSGQLVIAFTTSCDSLRLVCLFSRGLVLEEGFT